LNAACLKTAKNKRFDSGYVVTGCSGFAHGGRRQFATGLEFISRTVDLDAPLHWVNVRIKKEQRWRRTWRESADAKLRFRDLLDNVALMAVMVNPRAQITYCNEYFSRLTGWTFDELHGRPWHDIFAPPVMDDSALFAAGRFNDACDACDAWRVEKDILTRSGERRIIRWNNILLRDVIGTPVAAAGIGEDVTDHKKVERALMDCHAKERCSLERDLHDGLGQELAGIALLAKSLATSADRDKLKIATDLARLSTIASDAIESCRRIAREMSPFSDLHGGLVQALRQLTVRPDDGRGAAIKFVVCQTAPLALSADASDQVYRIAQEWLTILQRYAAGSIIVSVNIHPAVLRLEVVDDGVAAPRMAQSGMGVGLKMLQHRAALLGAQLTVETPVPCGNRLLLELGQPA
jgi:PAS domain S-box-containing protein